MIIDENGDIGIGTNIPSEKLHIKGTNSSDYGLLETMVIMDYQKQK